ncbi:FAD-binding oxidoreductase [Baileyella intestinalis]|uniref:FAD-binding oxidoreductase n=1 Tax=Baileyella intestinalis TaxID=2606709 RepID=UPI003A8594D4
MTESKRVMNDGAFREQLQERRDRIDSASTKIRKTFPVNDFARRLHPVRQYMKISKIMELEPGTKCFRFVPDKARGTDRCAPFIAGQYLDVYITINGMMVSRPYSISSSPKEAEEGFYELTIKYVEDGLVSRYVLDNWKEGDEVELSGPEGSFFYSLLRDARTVVCLAGGSGITPFLSLAQAIADGYEDFNMVLLYGSRSEDHILYKDKFDSLEKASDKIKVVHVLSDEEKEGFEHGFITADMIRKYSPSGEYSVFICGPQQMYRFVDREIEKLGLQRKFVRHELFGEIHEPAGMEDYPGANMPEVKITVSVRDMRKTVTGSVNDSIMQIMEKNGIAVPASCRSGECGFCRSQLISGDVYVPKAVDGRRLADFKFGGIHPCVTFPLSDLEIIVPYAK